MARTARPSARRRRPDAHPVEDVVQPRAEHRSRPVEPGDLPVHAVEDEAQVVEHRAATATSSRGSRPPSSRPLPGRGAAPGSTRFGLRDARFAVTHEPPGDGSTSRTVHQASRPLYVRDRTSSIVNRVVTMPHSCRAPHRARGCHLRRAGPRPPALREETGDLDLQTADPPSDLAERPRRACNHKPRTTNQFSCVSSS